MDGASLARVVQNMNPKVKVLAMSGLSSAGRSGNLKPFNGPFIYKPFKVQALLEEIHNLLHPAPVASCWPEAGTRGLFRPGEGERSGRKIVTWRSGPKVTAFAGHYPPT